MELLSWLYCLWVVCLLIVNLNDNLSRYAGTCCLFVCESDYRFLHLWCPLWFPKSSMHDGRHLDGQWDDEYWFDIFGASCPKILPCQHAKLLLTGK
jgi:hypothetical protein